MTCLVGNCLCFLQFLAKINLLKPQKTYIYRFLPNLPAAMLFWIAIICRQIAIAMNWIDVICCRPQLPVPAFQTRLRLNNTDTPAQPRSRPDIKKLPKQFHLTTSEAFRQNPEYPKSNSYSDNQKSSEIINHLRASIHIQASHSFYYDYIMNN